MNSKLSITIFLFYSLITSGCGVKGPPAPHDRTRIPSYIDKYTKNPQVKKTDTKKKSDIK